MKKGFTLIELLSVIVILGVIALITSPLITGIIQNSKKGAFEDSVYGIIKTVDLDKAESKFNVNKIYTIEPGSIIDNTNGLPLETKGTVNGEGVVRLDEDGNIQLIIQYEDWCATKEYDNKEVVIRPAPCIPNADLEANTPWMLSNMVPVKWETDKWVRADSRNPASNTWYKYEDKQWANAVLVKENNSDPERTRNFYTSEGSIGREVNMEDILAFFVWIPRFNYAISSTNQIDINFEEGVPQKLIGDGQESSPLTHPAFSFGEKELTGFWFAKFETTGEYVPVETRWNLRVLPSENSIVDIPFSQFYSALDEFSYNDNVYGFSKSRVDVRIVKNIEWGAVSYLTNSDYGRCNDTICETVRRNNTSTFITGCAGNTNLWAASSTCSNNYSSANGVLASTTANVYGIYDMAGGAYDFVMGNYRDLGGQTGLTQLPDTRYYDRYTQSNVSIACGGFSCLGHGLSETSGWYSGTANFVNEYNPWLLRGNTSENLSVSSIYSFERSTGEQASNIGYRLTFSNR